MFATAVGDIVNTSSSTTQYARADTAYDTLDAGGGSLQRRPRQPRSSAALFNTYFGTSRFTGKSLVPGVLPAATTNNYSFFSASGNDFILINLSTAPPPPMLDWADALLKANLTQRGSSSSTTSSTSTTPGRSQTSYNALKDNPNLFLMLCGHMHTAPTAQPTGQNWAMTGTPSTS